MTTTERPPAGLEYKTAALAAPPLTGADPAVWEGIVGVTGAPTDGGITYAPGAVTRAVARRWPKVTTGPSWLRRGGVVEAIEEIEPGDPRIPATLADSTPWPAGAEPDRVPVQRVIAWLLHHG